MLFKLSLKLAKFFLAAVTTVFFGVANASFHLWNITEVYSNADGSVQYIELIALAGGQQFLSGHKITSTSGGQTKTFFFSSDLPGDSAETSGGGIYGELVTNYRSFLVATQGFAALNLVAPDYVVPNGFLSATNGTINFADADVFTYAAVPTTGGLSLNRNLTAGPSSPTNFMGATGTIRPPVTVPNFSDMWWAGDVENGWGMSIQQHGNIQFNALYIYDTAGKPTWYVMSGGNWNPDFTIYTGALYSPRSAPLDNYTPAQFVVGASPGTATLSFVNNNAMTLNVTINGVSQQKSLTRLVFATTGSAPMQVGDMWWAGDAQNGWGLNLVQQGNTNFGVWYTYSADGKPTWYILPGGTWTGTTFSGAMYNTTGSPWLGVTYDPKMLVVNNMGTMTLNFANANSATMSYTFSAGPYSGLTQTKSLLRLAY